MAASETSFQGPRACPFVALELDRDRRSERPDYRHRCFAEPTPAPRSMAHQEAYCLSPSFAACPIFQDWAVRAAAAPVGTVVAPTAASIEPRDEPALASPPTSPVEPAPAADIEPPLGEPPFVAPLPIAPPPAQAAASAWDTAADAQQLSAFDAPAGQPRVGSFTPAPPDDEPRSSFGEPDAGYMEPPDLPLPGQPEPEPPPDYVPPPPRREQIAPTRPEEAAVPAFLSGRSGRPTTSPLPPSRPTEPPPREEIVPSWAIDGRYGAEPPDEGGRGSRFDNLLTAIAVIAILALGVAGVIFLPGLLAGTPGPNRTPPPSIVRPSVAPSVAPSIGPSASPSADVSLEPTAAPTTVPSAAPTDTPGPEATPITYRIKAGDSLARIARRYGVTVEEILAANPQIEDPNHIEVGQRIVIPPPGGG